MKPSEEFRNRSQIFYSYAPEGLSEAPFYRFRITPEPGTSGGFKQWSIDGEYRAGAIEDGGIDSPVREIWKTDPSMPAWRGLSANQVLDIAVDAAPIEHRKLLKEFLGLHHSYEWERQSLVPPINMPVPAVLALPMANDNLALKHG